LKRRGLKEWHFWALIAALWAFVLILALLRL